MCHGMLPAGREDRHGRRALLHHLASKQDSASSSYREVQGEGHVLPSLATWPPNTLRLLWGLACARGLTSFPLWSVTAWLKATERFGGHLLRFCRSDEAKRRVYEGYLTLHKDWLSELLEKRQLTDRQGEDRLLLEAIEQELRELRT